MGLFSCSIPPSFVLSHHVPMVNTTSNWLCFGAFLSPPVPSLRIHWPLTTGRCSRATGHYSRATRHYLPRPSPAGYCLPPTAELRKIEWARSGRADPLSYYAPKQAIPAENPIRSPPLAAARPLIILSWPEALNASGSKRACRMAISRNACSLVALPDFPELAQAVRYGVTGTPPSSCRPGLRLCRSRLIDATSPILCS